MKSISKKELNELINSGIEEFNDLIISDIKSNECNFDNLTFNRCEFKGLKLTDTSLTNICFNESKFLDCDFSESKLNMVSFKYSNLENVDFNKCIDNSREQYSWASNNFKKCRFESVEVLSSIEIVGCSFFSCNFENAFIKCPEFCNGKIEDCNMKHINIDSCMGGNKFIDVNLEQSNIESFFYTNNFQNVNFKKACINGPIGLDSKKFSNCILQECDLFGLDSTSKIELEGFNLEKIIIEDGNWRNSDLKDCNLTEANMKETDLSGSNLENAILKSANLEGANLKNSNLKNADLEGANFSGAVLDGVRILRKDYKYIEQYIDESKVVFEN